jgi:hypothetical protein
MSQKFDNLPNYIDRTPPRFKGIETENLNSLQRSAGLLKTKDMQRIFKKYIKQ